MSLRSTGGIRGWVSSRLTGRSDSEHQQVLIRVFIAVLVTVYLLWIHYAAPPNEFGIEASLLVAAFTWLYTLGIFTWLLWNPVTCHPRRITAVFCDYTVCCALLTLEGETAALMYAVILWVTVGNGLRYGARYLLLAATLGAIAILIPGLVNPFWSSYPFLVAGLAITLVAVPAYVYTLKRQLDAAVAEARSASQVRSRFLATMSHELRSPLHAILGLSERLTQSNLSPSQSDATRGILTATGTLLELVDDVLDINQIESGKLRARDEPFALEALRRRISVIIEPQAKAKGLDYSFELHEDLPAVLQGDSGHLLHVLLNLFSNAVKFTDVGAVGATARLLERSGSTITIEFRVFDTGIGIPQPARQRIFQAFEQVDSGRDRKYGGTGLGTYIAKTLLDHIGGSIRIEDNAPRGTIVVVTATLGIPSALPQSNIDDAPSIKEAVRDHRLHVRPLRVAILDDQPVNRKLLRWQLNQAGHSVVSSSTGESLLRRLEMEEFDVAYIDWHMPEMSGEDVLASINRNMLGPRRPVVFVLSADVSDESRSKAISLGADAYFSKPMPTVRLLESLEAAAMRRGLWSETPLSQDVAEDESAPEDDSIEHVVASAMMDMRGAIGAMGVQAIEKRWPRVREQAHALKGVALSVGAVELTKLAARIEHADDSTLESLFPGIRSTMDAAVPAMDDLFERFMDPNRRTSGDHASGDGAIASKRSRLS